MEYTELTNQEESIVNMAARKFKWMLSKGLEFGDLLQEGRLAILDLQRKNQRTNNPKILYVAAYTGILRGCLSYATMMPHGIASLTKGMTSEDQLDELIQRIKNNKKYSKYIKKQYKRLGEKLKITEEELIRHKAKVILRDSINMRQICNETEELIT